MKRKFSGLLYDGCRFLIEIDCASPAWGAWVRCRRDDYVGRLVSMMGIIRELNGGTAPKKNKVQPEVTPAMCRWWTDAQKLLDKTRQEYS